MSFDDRPVGGGVQLDMANSPPRQEEDFSRMPLDKQLTNSNWKARKTGYEAIVANPQKTKSLLLANMKSCSNESMAAALEPLMEAAKSVVPCCGAGELDAVCAGLVPLAIEKGITGRPKTVQFAQEFLALLVEHGKPSEVFDSVIGAFTQKSPKNRAAAAQVCGYLVSDFGVAGIPLKPVLKATLPLFNDANPQVRKEASTICCQCYKYLGAGIKPFLSDLREVQVQELDAQFQNITVGQTPPRTIKGSTTAAPSPALGRQSALANSLAGASCSVAGGDLAFDLLDESPIMSKLPKNFFRQALDKETPWQDRCQYVNDNLMPLLAAPRYRGSDDYHELAAFIRLYLLDPQAPPMLLGFKMIQECARGLRNAFGAYARQYLTPLFEKMKDKKTSVLEHVMTTLDTLLRYRCVTLDQCMEDMEQVTVSKNPSQRLALINFCLRLIDSPEGSEYTRFTRCTKMLTRMVNDEKASNKDVAYELLSKLSITFGEDPFRAVFNSLDEKQRVKMAEVSSRVASAATSSVASPQVVGLTPSTSPAKKVAKTEDSRPPGAVRRRTASQHVMRQRQTLDGSTSNSLASTMNGGASRHVIAEDPVSLEATLPPKMDVQQTFLGLMGGDMTVVDMIRSRDSANRVEGLKKIKAITDQWSSAKCAEHLDTVLVVLRGYPSLQESTLQAYQTLLDVLRSLFERASSVSLGASYVIVSECIPRLTETTNRATIKSFISLISQRTSTRFVVKHITVALAQSKVPKLLQEANEFLVELIDQLDPGIDTEPIEAKGVVEYVKKPCFELKQPIARPSAVNVLLALRRRAGTTLLDSLVASCPAPIRSAYAQELERGGNEEDLGATTTSTVLGATTSTTSPRISGRRPRPAADTASRPSASATASPEKPLPPRPRPSTTTNPRRSVLPPLSGAVSAGQSGEPRPSVASPSAGMGASELPANLRNILREITRGEDWRDRLDAVHSIDDYMDSVGRVLPDGSAAHILKVLGTRLTEANKNFVVDVLRTISVVVEVAGPDESRHALRQLLPGVLSYLGDQKTTLREEAMRLTLTTVQIVGLDSVLPALQKPLTSDSNVCRQNTLEAMLFGLNERPQGAHVSRSGLSLLVPAIVSSLMDRIQEVRAAAESVMGHCFTIIGEEPFYRRAQTLKVADQNVVIPAIERQLQLFTPANDAMSNFSGTVNTINLENEEEERTPKGRSPVPHPRRNSSTPATPRRRDSLLTPRRRGNSLATRDVPQSTQSAQTPPQAPPDRAARASPSASPPNVAGVAESKLHPTTHVHSRPSVGGGGRQAAEMTAKQPNATASPPRAAPAPRAVARVLDEEAYADDSLAQTTNSLADIYSVQEILVGLRSANTAVACTMCSDFMQHMHAEGGACGSPAMLDAMVTRLYENTQKLEPDLAHGLIECMNTMLVRPEVGSQCDSAFIFRLLGTMFDCLLSEQFSLHERVLKSLNNMTLKVLEHCPANDVFSALVSRMASYSTTYLQTGRKSDLKYIQVTVKCVMRLTLDGVAAENVALCCHEYLLQHPPSAFRNLDDLPIRTVKTILQNETRRYGADFLKLAESSVGAQSLVAHFIRACLDSLEKARKNKTSHDEQAMEDSIRIQRASQSPAPSAPTPKASTPHRRPSIVTTPRRAQVVSRHADPAPAVNEEQTPPPVPHTAPAVPTAAPTAHKSVNTGANMTVIFARIRNHLTSLEGIEDLYTLLKNPPVDYEDDFDHQFSRCSEAFRMYIKRKLEHKASEDPHPPVLPTALRTLS